jgi:hypothetical protein
VSTYFTIRADVFLLSYLFSDALNFLDALISHVSHASETYCGYDDA